MSNKQQKNKEFSKSKSKKCFFITPIGSEDSHQFRRLSDLLDNVVNDVLEHHGYDTVVAHKINTLGSISDQVFNEIIESDLVLSNISELNANVMYETAVAHSFGKPTIMIADKELTDLPFDLIADRTIFFENTIGGAGKLKKELSKKIEAVLGDSKIDNPVYRVLKKNKSLSMLDEDAESGDETASILLNLVDEVNKLSDIVKNNDNKFTIEENYMIKKVNIYVNKEKINDSDVEEMFEEIDNLLEKGYDQYAYDFEYFEYENQYKLVISFEKVVDKRNIINIIRRLFNDSEDNWIISRITTNKN